MGKTILVVEDEITLSEALTEKLGVAGYQVVVARNGEEGLRQAEEKKPDLILLDIIMPIMDGIQMLKSLREAEWGKGMHVIMLTNLSDNEKLAECMQHGTFDYVVKSDVQLSEIVEKVKEKISG